MTISTVTNERLKEIIERRSPSLRWGEAELIAAELLAVREAQSVPFAYMHRSGQVITREECGNDEVFAICCKVETPLYTAPPAPAVPDVIEPTYEAIKAILPTANPDEYACCVGADMWNACRGAMLRHLPDGENCWTCGKYFTYAQHSECDGYCPHCNAPVDLDDEDQPSQVVPVEPTEDMVSKAWREALGKCDHETIKRMYATMLAAAPTPTKAVNDENNI